VLKDAAALDEAFFNMEKALTRIGGVITARKPHGLASNPCTGAVQSCTYSLYILVRQSNLWIVGRTS